MSLLQAVIACALAVAGAAYSGPLAGGLPAAQYPAGVSPQACPNYPNCANPAVAVSPNALPQQYAAQPQYQQQPQYQPAPQYQQPAPQQYQQPQYSPVSQYNPVYSQQYNPAPQAAQQQYAPDVQNALDRGEYIGDGDYHGEGLAEALAPGYNGKYWKFFIFR